MAGRKQPTYICHVFFHIIGNVVCHDCYKASKSELVDYTPKENKEDEERETNT